MLKSSQKKSTQALNYFARKKGGQINKLKAVKLIYFADRYHLRKYGRPVIGDDYWAMKLGPVGSVVLNTADLSGTNLEPEYLKYAESFLTHPKGDHKSQEIISKKDVDLGVFSQTDIEALETAFKEFGDKDQFELATLSHAYPEWSKHREAIVGGKKRVKMSYDDFFANPRVDGSSIFKIPVDRLETSKEAYREYSETVDILG